MLGYSVFKSRVLEGNTTMDDAFNSGARGASSGQAISTAGEVSKILASSNYNNGPPPVTPGAMTPPVATTPLVATTPPVAITPPAVITPTAVITPPAVITPQKANVPPVTQPSIVSPVNTQESAAPGSNVSSISVAQTLSY